MADDRSSSRAALARRAGAIAQGLVLGFLVVLGGMELAALAGQLSPFKYQGY